MTIRSTVLLRWEAAGALFIIVVGSALHFVFAWSGRWPPVALFAAVNESIWEHLKLAFWPGLLWGLLPARGLGISRGERLALKGISLLITSVAIIAIFVSYTHILGSNYLAMDIGTFVLAVVAGQAAHGWMSAHALQSHSLLRIGSTLLVLQLAAFTFFTFFAPDHWLFIDSRTGENGLPSD